MLKLEQNVSHTFQDYDRTERELFTAFTNAIRDSHEKQRAQMEYTKYFGLILGIAGSFLTFVYSTVKKNDLKRFIEKNLDVSNLNEETRREIIRVGVRVSELANVMQRNIIQQNKTSKPSILPVPTNLNRSVFITDDVDISKTVLKVLGGLVVILIVKSILS